MSDLVPLSMPRYSLPWQNAIEDHWAAEEAIRSRYDSLNLKPPRFAWAMSPRGLFIATRMMRQVQVEQAYNMVRALVPVGADIVEAEAKRTLLTAMIDPKVTTQSGAWMGNHLAGATAAAYHPAIAQLAGLIRFSDADERPGDAKPRFHEQVVYPALYGLYVVARQAFCMIPYVHLVWLCVPPVYVQLRGDDLSCENGPVARWPDGYEVWARRTERGALEAGSGPALGAADQRLLEGGDEA